MQTPVEIQFINLNRSEAVEARIRERADRLEQFFGRITSCHVFVDAPHHHANKGNAYEIRIEVRIPGRELVVNRRPGDVHAHHDIYVAIRDAFDAMERQLKATKADPRTALSGQEAQLQGRIAELQPAENFGRIATVDNRLVYFHKNSVVDVDFAELQIDDPVELVVDSEESAAGPQASTVRRISPSRYIDRAR
ncbi:MAG: HPF/RaiA family ribosome-associated protein [Hyphomicrobiaceae bacterium]